MTSQEMVTISKIRLIELESAEHKLSCVEGAGVDNWSGYEDAMDLMREEIMDFKKQSMDPNSELYDDPAEKLQ